MDINKCSPISTVYGTPCGRDAIYLDDILCDYLHNSMIFKGQFNGHLLTNSNVDGFIDYVLEFTGIYIYRMTELDLSYDLLDIKCEGSSFFEILGSELVRHAKKIRDVELRHFIFATYDDVFEIVCKDYRLDIGNIPNNS